MKHFYILPIKKFNQKVDDKVIIKAWKSGKIERFTPEDFAESINNEYFCEINNWVRVIDSNNDFFEISCIHRDDLESIGYDTSKVDDAVMKKLASKLAGDYCEQLFWNSLRIFADSLEIPKHKVLN